jgi:hypothetical protein
MSSVIRASLPCPGKEPHRNPTNGLNCKLSLLRTTADLGKEFVWLYYSQCGAQIQQRAKAQARLCVFHAQALMLSNLQM